MKNLLTQKYYLFLFAGYGNLVKNVKNILMFVLFCDKMVFRMFYYGFYFVIIYKFNKYYGFAVISKRLVVLSLATYTTVK
jgi:hypothetical protein